MTSELIAHVVHLRDILRQTGGCAVAYSGGVDSSLVLAVAHETLAAEEAPVAPVP